MLKKNSLLYAICLGDLKIYVRRSVEWASPLLFFFMVVSIFAISISSSVEILQNVGTGMIWIALVLATLMSLEHVLRQDYEDGVLEQLSLSSVPLANIMLSKALAHWVAIGVPLILISPLLGLMLHLTPESIIVLMTTLMLATPIFSLIGLMGAALTLGVKRGGILITILTLPLYVPIIIFGIDAIGASQEHLPITGQLALLGALLILSIMFAPLAIAAAVKICLAE